jgi:hypothetical protein
MRVNPKGGTDSTLCASVLRRLTNEALTRPRGGIILPKEATKRERQRETEGRSH